MDLNSINIVEIDGNSKSKLKLLNPNKIRILRSTTTTSGTTTTLTRPSSVLLGSTTVSTVVSPSAPVPQRIEEESVTTTIETQEEIGELADAETQELLPHEININDMDLERGNRMSANVVNVGDINEAVVVTTEVTTVTTTPVVDEVGLDGCDTENGLMVIDDEQDDQEEEETEITDINNSGEILCDQDPDDDRDKIDANSNPLELSAEEVQEEELEEMEEMKNKSPSPQAPRTKTNVLIHKFGDIELSLVDVEDDSAEKVRTITHINKNHGNRNQSGGVGGGGSRAASEFNKSQSTILKSSTGQVTHVLLRQGNESEDGVTTSTSGETHDQNHNEPTQVILETETSNFSETEASNKPKIRNAIPRPPLRNQNTNQQNNNVENVEVEDGEDMDEENENTASMWNQNNCIVCNVVLDPCDPSTLTTNKEGNLKLKKFFFEYLGVNESMDITNDTSFPFCFSCNEDLDKLMALACKIEFMDLQFEKLRDTLARKTVKTYLVRTRPEILDEDAEQVLDLSDEPLEGYAPKTMVNSADLLFNQWKRQYDMIIPGRFKKFPTLMKTVDPKQRVSYYRIDAAGKHHFITTINPDMSATEQSTTPVVSTATTNNKSLQRGTKRRSYTSVVKINPGDMPTVKRVKQISSLDDSIESPTDDELMNEGNGGGGGEHMVLIGEAHGGDMEHQHLISFDGGQDEQSEDKIFKCIHCPKSFTSRSILNYHSRVHSGERPFKCNLCDKSFAQRGGLATHALVHSGEKPYNCEECGKSFRQKYHLTQHQLIHSGLKPFSCEICHKSFNVKMNLREHMRRHTGERPYRCTYCNCQGFFRKKMLRDHIVKSHPDSPLPPDLQVLGPTPKFPKVKTNNNKTMEDMQQMFHEEEAEATVLNHSASSSSSKLISHHHNAADAVSVSGGIKGILIKTEAGSDPNQNQNQNEQSLSMVMSHEDDDGADGEEPEPEEDDRLDDSHQDDELSDLPTSATTTTTTTTTTLISINLNEQNDSRNQLGSILEESTSQEQVHDPHDNGNDNDGNGNGDEGIPTLGLVSMEEEEESELNQNQTSGRSEGPPEPILAMGKLEQQVNENESEEVAETEVEIQMNTSSLGDGDGDPDNLTSNSDPESSNLLMGDNITVTTVTVDEALEMDGVVSST